MKRIKEAMLLYAITDRTWQGEESLIEQVKEALKGGASCLQLREKELNLESFSAQDIESECKLLYALSKKIIEA